MNSLTECRHLSNGELTLAAENRRLSYTAIVTGATEIMNDRRISEKESTEQRMLVTQHDVASRTLRK